MKLKKNKKGDRKRPPLFSLIVGGVFLALLLISLFYPEPEEKISLSRLSREVNRGKVETLTVKGEEITVGYKKEKESEMALKEPDRGATETLLALGTKKEKLKEVDIKFEQETQIWKGIGSAAITLLPSLIIIFLFWKLLQGAKGNAAAAFDFTKAKAKLFGPDGEEEGEETSFEDVGGLKQAKQELKEVIDFLKDPDKYFRIGAQIPRGVLLIGPPGTGKTLLARAVANEAGVPFFSISGAEFIELFVGVGASRVRNLFSQAKKAGKAIIFIDEIDSIGKARGKGLRGGGLEEREQTLNQILAEMDGFEKRSGVIVMGATNKPEALDAALLRPGRFDRRIALNRPDIKDRKDILEIHARGKPLGPEVDLREIAERTPGFSGADLENLLNEAAILAARKNKQVLSQSLILYSIEKVMLGPERKSHLLNKEEKRIAAYHEAGHALIASSLGEEKVRKVSIIARGQATGYTMKMPEEEKRMKTKSHFLADIATLFGGYTAEKMKFGEVSTGAANDLQKATAVAKKIVKQYGMSALGPISFEKGGNLSPWEKVMIEGKSYSEQTAARIDKEVAEILSRQRKRAEKTLEQEKEMLEALAQALIKEETLNRKEFEKIKEKS